MESILQNFRDHPDRRAPAWARAVTVAVLLLLFSAACWALLGGTARNWAVFWNYRAAFWDGWLITIQLSVCSLILSTLIGLVAAAGRRSRILPIRYLATMYVELVRGMPFLVLILVLFYGIPQITQHGDRFFFGVLFLSLFSGAYIAEIIRAGINSLAAYQWESARAIGLTKSQTYRYIIFPQALKNILPPLTGQFASLIKDSSLLSVIGLNEFTHSAQTVFSATYSGLESFLPLGVGYLILTLSVSLVARELERRQPKT